MPGAGQLYLGQPLAGIAILAFVEGLYLAGLALSDGRAFEYLDPELRGLFAPALSPEIANLGGFLWQLRDSPFGDGRMHPWPEWMRLGSYLTAASGVANVVAMVHAHTSARVEPRARAVRPAVAVALAWLVPGLGHVLQRRFLRGAIVFALLFGLFAAGTAMAESSNLSRERHFYYWAGQFLIGLPGIAAEALCGSMRVEREIAYVDAGLVFGCVAGLLNVLAMIDVYGWSEAQALGRDPKARHAAAPETGARPA